VKQTLHKKEEFRERRIEDVLRNEEGMPPLRQNKSKELQGGGGKKLEKIIKV